MIHELSHPLAKTLINQMRRSNTNAVAFRHCIAELSRLLAYEALRDAPLTDETIPTWQGDLRVSMVDDASLVLVPILRAGMPMLDPLMGLLGNAAAGFLAMKRDEVTHKAVLYYDRVPDVSGKRVILLDPMVATGGSLCDAMQAMKAKGAKQIISLNLIGAPEGLARVEAEHPDCPVYIAQIDEHLNESKFIIPGLGDAGDRAYNTPEV